MDRTIVHHAERPPHFAFAVACSCQCARLANPRSITLPQDDSTESTKILRRKLNTTREPWSKKSDINARKSKHRPYYIGSLQKLQSPTKFPDSSNRYKHSCWSEQRRKINDYWSFSRSFGCPASDGSSQTRYIVGAYGQTVWHCNPRRLIAHITRKCTHGLCGGGHYNLLPDFERK